MTAESNIEIGAACLGYAGTAATWWRMKPSEDPMKKGWRQQPQVTILEAESTDENGHTPASSVAMAAATPCLAICPRRRACRLTLANPDRPGLALMMPRSFSWMEPNHDC
mgnify:CR=1 FL=1